MNQEIWNSNPTELDDENETEVENFFDDISNKLFYRYEEIFALTKVLDKYKIEETIPIKNLLTEILSSVDEKVRIFQNELCNFLNENDFK